MNMDTEVPTAGRVATSCIYIITIIILTAGICMFLSRVFTQSDCNTYYLRTDNRTHMVKSWRRLPVTAWLLLTIYVASLIFTATTVIVEKSFSINESFAICDISMILCEYFFLRMNDVWHVLMILKGITFYLSTKIVCDLCYAHHPFK